MRLLQFIRGSSSAYQEIFLSWLIMWSWSVGQLPNVFCPFIELIVYSCQDRPIFSLIGRSDFLNFPANVLVVSYSCFMNLLAAALSASSTSPSTKSRLSVLTLFLTFFYLLLCALSGRYFAAIVRLLLTAPLIVSAEIQSFCCGFLLPSTSSHVVLLLP